MKTDEESEVSWKRKVFSTQSAHQSIAFKVEGRVVIEDDVVRWNARWRRLGARPVDVAHGCASAPRLWVAVNVLSPGLCGIMLVPLTCRLQAYCPTTTLNTFAFLRTSLDVFRSLHGEFFRLCLLLPAELKNHSEYKIRLETFRTALANTVPKASAEDETHVFRTQIE